MDPTTKATPTNQADETQKKQGKTKRKRTDDSIDDLFVEFKRRTIKEKMRLFLAMNSLKRAEYYNRLNYRTKVDIIRRCYREKAKNRAVATLYEELLNAVNETSRNALLKIVHEKYHKDPVQARDYSSSGSEEL